MGYKILLTIATILFGVFGITALRGGDSTIGKIINCIILICMWIVLLSFIIFMWLN